MVSVRVCVPVVKSQPPLEVVPLAFHVAWLTSRAWWLPFTMKVIGVPAVTVRSDGLQVKPLGWIVCACAPVIARPRRRVGSIAYGFLMGSIIEVVLQRTELIHDPFAGHADFCRLLPQGVEITKATVCPGE